jgi:hypothetical protein
MEEEESWVEKLLELNKKKVAKQPTPNADEETNSTS